MKLNFTIRGLFIAMTLISILLAIGVYLAKASMFVMIIMGVFAYLAVFNLFFYLRFRAQVTEARKRWNEWKRDLIADSRSDQLK